MIDKPKIALGFIPRNTVQVSWSAIAFDIRGASRVAIITIAAAVTYPGLRWLKGGGTVAGLATIFE